jgi:pimeloyl-ACP methyl ester carboxylesterase
MTSRIDSLGHGDSDGPADCSAYGPSQRVGDVIAVLDQVGVDAAYVVG